MNNKRIYNVVALLLLVLTACEETLPTREVKLDAYPSPSIELLDDLEDDTVRIMIEDAYPFSFRVAAEAGLVNIELNDLNVYTFPYGQLKDNIEYGFVMPDVEDTVLQFTVFDETGGMASTMKIVAKAEGRLDPLFMISDLGGAFMQFEDEPMDNQGGGNFAARVANTGGLLTDSYTIRALWQIDEPMFMNVFTLNTSEAGGAEALKIVKNGGFANVIVNLGNAIPELYINDVKAGKRAFQFEVYYDNTANPDDAGDLPLALSMDLFMANFSKYKNDQAGILETYTGTIPGANTWHTVTLSVKNGGRRTGDVAANEVDAFSLKLSPGYNTQNPYYLRNFRVVKIE